MAVNRQFLVNGRAGLGGSHIADLPARERAGEIVILDDFVRGK